MKNYILCHRCTCAVEYCDYSAFAFEEELEAKVIQWVEKVGLITHIEEITDYDNPMDYWECNACGAGADTFHRWQKD